MHKNTKRNSKNCFGTIWSIGDLVAILKVIYFEVRIKLDNNEHIFRP